MKKGLLLGGLFAIIGLVRAQDIPVLPTGYYIDFKQ